MSRTVKLDTFWRNSENRKYLDEMFEPLDSAPQNVKDSYAHYVNQIHNEKLKIQEKLGLSTRDFKLHEEMLIIAIQKLVVLISEGKLVIKDHHNKECKTYDEVSEWLKREVYKKRSIVNKKNQEDLLSE